jgi:hypothetical protein
LEDYQDKLLKNMPNEELAKVITDRGIKLAAGEAVLPQYLRGKGKKKEANIFVSQYTNN